MTNYNINLLVVGLQKYLSVQDFLNTLPIAPNEYIEILKFFKRDIKNCEQYINKYYYKKNTLKRKIIEYLTIYNNSEELSLEKITEIFRFEPELIISFLNYIIRKNIFLSPLIFSNKTFYSEFEKISHKNSKEKIKNSKNKLFKGNSKNISLLLEQSEYMAIEEIALYWEVSPFLISNELMQNRKGGYWENENIRINAPFFIDNTKNRYSTEEIFYIIEKIDSPFNELLNKMNTSEKNLSLVKREILELLDNYSSFELKEMFFNKNMYKNVKYGEKINFIKNIKKDNKEFIFDYDFKNLFTYKDILDIEKYSLAFFEKIDKKNKIYQNLENKILIGETSKDKFYGYFFSESLKEISLKLDDNKILKILKSDILYIKILN